MIFDFQHMRESKRVHRERLATRPLGEKLRMLDALRERELAIRGRAVSADSATVDVRDANVSCRISPQ